ncbi:caspase recruitment domain-containing protein 14 [Bufo gargarizans]|uniref:caspase recruitment domain-containing protein 14 n=1 Tax=Bufo gargarizans TaxID=30331 RepID=UPI001CF35225|nr:caspase recruitment domain-containing protein 14 [Bufo gargarizans]XP_044156256.1 caspase recruitment domain-containing protein 14 [Bufo gargarizans]XP_044156257.1 caspase recruitment domain-containing protein 14 [Bufo gargarizans]XP_044156258.1 caspase recruitment domain-containing protein 14 [Bufo gargarizans]
MAVPSQTDPDLMDLEDEELWDMIEKHRCKIVQRLSPERLTPYLRQARVIDAMDEEDILHCARFSTRAMRLGHLLDVLHTRGKNGATAFLESLMLVNPRLYTHITGKEANKDPNSFTRLIDTSQLSAFLMNTLSSLQEELMQEKQLKGTLLHHLHKMREKQQQLKEEGECMRSMEHENQRLRREMDAQSQMLSKLKDEQYELSMRYSHALQEKDAVQGRNSDLQEQLYLVKEELHRVKMELQVAQSWTSRVKCEEELEVLQKENRMLKEKLEGQNKLVEMDGSNQRSNETLPDSERLRVQLTTAKKKIAAGEASEKLWKEEKETILQDCRHLQNNYDILKKKTEAFHDQVDELQKERDQAYRARDMVQAEILQFLNEKDSLRKQVMKLTECNSELKQQIRSLEEQLQIWMMRKDDQEDAEQTPSKHQRLVRMDAICPSDDGDKGSSCSTSESWQDLGCQANSDLAGRNSCSSLEDVCISRLSKSCSNELPDLLEAERTEADFDFEYKKGLELLSHMDISERSYDLGCLESPVRRRYAQRMSSRLTSIAFPGDDLLKQISIIGGNRTGIFIHQVTPRSAADEMSLLPGYQIMAVHFDVLNPAYKVDLEGMTFEDAHCTLNRVNGFCCLSVRCNMEDYRKLLNTIQNGVLTSGDSFYVRVNLSMAARVEGGLQVKCGDILHITNTMYKNRCQWFAHRVNNYTMKDGESGIIPNYRQAQQQLITSIQRMTWQNGIPRMPKKHVRIISTDRCSSHLLWTSLNCGTCRCEEPTASSSLGRSCLTLMPYTLVTHYKIGVPRPVLLVPSLLGRILSDKLCANKDFMKCDTECLTDAEYATRYQRGDIIGEKEGESIRCCFTRQNVEAVAQQNAHCLLELGLSCLSALIRVGIYPIILHIPLSEKSTKKLRKTRQWWGKCEDLLLECAQREEAELDSLPCLYSTVYADSWSDTDSLLCTVKDAILDEQKRIIWLENQPCCP